MLVLDQLGTSIRARPRTGPLKFIRVSKKGRSVVCRSRLIAILPNPFRAYTYKAGESGCRCPPGAATIFAGDDACRVPKRAQGLSWERRRGRARGQRRTPRGTAPT